MTILKTLDSTLRSLLRNLKIRKNRIDLLFNLCVYILV
ncbi:Uncharacterised protein [Segatella copri]|nr:Uncharacterised protein [Segatella copri]